jgi:hypothetical protein
VFSSFSLVPSTQYEYLDCLDEHVCHDDDVWHPSPARQRTGAVSHIVVTRSSGCPVVDLHACAFARPGARLALRPGPRFAGDSISQAGNFCPRADLRGPIGFDGSPLVYIEVSALLFDLPRRAL